MNEKKQYIIQIPGEEHVAYWSEEKYGLNEEELFKNYPNAQVTEMTMADPMGDLADDDQFAISIPGESHVAQWDGKKLAANREQLMQMYPDAQVSRLTNVTAQRDADFVQRYEDATNAFSMENARFIHDNTERYNALMEKYRQPQEQEEKSGNFLKGAKQSIMGTVGGLMNAAAESLRSLRIARFGQFADDTLWEEANKEYERRIAAGEPLFRNDAEPSTAEKAGWTKDDARAYARSKRVNALINHLQEKAEKNGENPEESVRASLNRQVETSDIKIIQDAANQIIENNSTPMKGWGKVGAMIPLAGTTAAAVALGATGNIAGAQALGDATMAAFAGSAAGSAMKQARDAGANTDQTGLAGLATAGIFYGMGKIPLNRAINGVVSSSAARSVAGVPWQGVEKEMNLLLSDAMKNGIILKGMEKQAGKVLAREFFKNWGAQIASHTTSFAAMSAMQALVPLIYEDADKYPVLNNVLQAAKEGAIDGLMLGALTGGITSGAELYNRTKRWEGRKSVNIAEVQFDPNNPPEVLEFDARRNQWVPSEDMEFGKAYFAEIVGANTGQGRPLTVLINEGGRTRMVRISVEDVRSMRSIGLEKARPEAENAYKEIGFEQGRQAETGEQREAVRNEQKYLEAKSQAEEQSGGVSEGTRLDLERANAAMEGRRDAVMSEIQQRTGQQFWKMSVDYTVSDENGMHPVTNYVRVATLKDGRQVFVMGEDERGYTFVDETGQNGFLDKNSPDIVSYERIDLNDYLDSRVQAQDAQAEQQRMQAEQVQNLGKVQQALMEHGNGERINLGTQEEENWVPIVGVDTNPNGGIVVQVDGVEQPMSWKEVAAKLGVPFEPKTSADLVQERLSADAQVNKYNGIPQGAELQVPIEGAEPMIYKFRSAELVEGDIIIRAEDPMSGDVVDLTPDIINNLDVLTENPQSVPDGVTYGPVLETQQRKNGTTVEIRAKTETKDGVSTTTAIGMRDGAEVGMPTAFMPMPEGLQIKEDYMSIFEDEEGNPRNDVELLGVHEIREGDNGAGRHVIGATIVVRDESGVTTYDVALERTTPPAEDVSIQIFDDPAANQLGITKDYAFTTKGGQIVVNGRKLWDENPRLWAKWNDANPDRNVTTKDFLEAKMQGINAEVSKARTNLEMEAKGNQDPDKLLELREKLNDKDHRRAEVQTLLDEYVAAEKALQEAAEAEERARKEAEDAAKAAAFQAELEAQRQERERKEAEHQVLMSQDEAFRARTEEYQAAPKYVGRATKVNVGGQEYPAHFVLMDAGTPLTSHDPLNNFTPTEGFGVDEQGRNLNTRAYDKEAEEQEGARAIGRHPDYRLIEYMPVVTYEGRAVSGNKRLSGRKLAAADGTDADLIKEYNDAREQFDFTEEQLAEFEHPVVVKQLDEPVPYTAKFFDAFNQSIGTAASTVALAAKVAKMTDDVLVNRVANLFVDVDDIQKFYQNPESVKMLFNILEAEKISPREDRPRYIDAEGKLTGAGEDFVESLLFGSIFSESDDAVRQAMADKSIRRAVAFAFPTLVRARNLKGDYSIIGEMTDAVSILAQAKADNQGKPEGAVEYYLLQPDLFTGETPVVAATTQLLARVLNDKKYGSLRKVLDQYIPRAELANEGQLGFNFDGEEGVLETKEDILSDVLKQNNIDIQTYGRTEAAAAEPELPANDEVYPPSGEYGGGRAEIERPAVEGAGGLQAEGNTAAEVAARDAEVAGRIADILSGKDAKRYKPSYEYDSGVNVPDKFIDEVSRQWDEHRSAVEAQRKPLQKRVSELVDSFHKEAEAEIKAKNPNVGEATLHNASIDIVDRKIKDSQEYQDLVKQIDALDEQVSPQTKDRFRQNAIGMLYADYAEQPASSGLDQLFSMLGTSREQAPMDRLQEKMTDIDRRVKENPADYDTLMEEKSAAIQEYLNGFRSVEGVNRIATPVNDLAGVMTKANCPQWVIDQAVSTIGSAKSQGTRARSFIFRNNVFVLSDNVKDAHDVDTAEIHEGEHYVTMATGDHILLAGLDSFDRDNILNAIDSWVGYIPDYHKLPDKGVANEFISHAIERTYGLPEEETVQILNDAGIESEEIINLVKNRNNARKDRISQLLSESRRGQRRGSNALEGGSANNPVGENGGNPQEGAGSGLDEQGLGSQQESLRRVGGGGQESERAAAERRVVKRTPQYEPATEQRLRAVDSLGSPKPEVITEIGKETTEGTALFSLDKDDRTLVGIHNISADKLGKALRMGGLANPSAAVIDIAKQNHFGYGDISLVMPSSLVDKSSGHNIGTFDRDAWTPTYPRIKYFESKQSRQRLNELIKDLPSELQYTLRYKVENYLNGDIYNSGLEYLFLKEKGMEIGMQRTPRKYPNASEKEFMTDYLKNPNLSWNGSHGSEIMDAYRALTPDERLSANLYMNQHGNADGIELIKQRIEKWPELKERYEKERSFAEVDSFLYGLVVDQRDAGKESTGLTIEKAIEVIKQNGLEEEFGYWQDKVIDSLGFDEKFYDHTTYDGTKKYKAHTLENVSAWMKKQGRNASSDHGLVMTSGTLMAKMAQKFNSLSQIRRAKSRLVPMGEEGKDYNAKIDDVKERIKNLVCSFWSDKLSRQSGLLTGELVALDYVQDFLILGKDLDSVVANYNATEHESLSLTDEEKAAFNALREDIRNLPVHYFETKFERPVYLNEFTAAVVPADTPEDIKQSLRDNQLKLFEYDRESDGDRRRAMLEAAQEDGVMFSFIGEIGAERLDAEQDREYRINGLSLAKTMDNHSADPHAIKVATGWEKGLDGKWRYEKRDFKEYDPDGNIQYKRRHPDLVRYEELLGKSNEYLFFPENHEPLTEAEQAEYNKLAIIWGRKPGDWTGKGWKHPYHNSSKLPDYIDDEELFQAYPEFRDTEIKFKDLPEDTGGYYNPDKNTIIVNAKDRYVRSRASDILLHEIQHMIQEIEGFSGGTSLEEAEWRATNERLTSNKLNNNQKEFVRSVGLWQNSPESWKSNVPLERYIGQVASRIGEEYYKKDLTGKDADGLIREYNRLVAMQNSAERLTPMEIYAYTSGEVEARNVVQRRRIGFQNPRTVLAEETEDIARKDQILNMPTYGLLDVDGLTESLKVAQHKTNKVPDSKAMALNLDEEVMFSLTKNNRNTIESWLKKREDLTDEDRTAVVEYLEELNDSKTQLATAKWFTKGTIRIPEDMPKVEQAISVAGKAKVDPLMYDSPMALLDAHADFKPTEKRIDPNTVKTLHKAKEYPEQGIVIYNVDDTEESRQNMREIINTHYGKDASPWCLLQGDGEGNLTEGSKRYWKHYNGYPKQVAFKDGKLLAFSANDSLTRLWWDRQDRSHYGVPVTQKVEGDELGRSKSHAYDPETGEYTPEPGAHMFRGNRQNGVYEEWSSDGDIQLEMTEYKDGKVNGTQMTWFSNGQIEKRGTYKDDTPVGKHEYWYSNGNKRLVANLNENGEKDGDQYSWHHNGILESESHFKDGDRRGALIQWNPEGKLRQKLFYDDIGALDGYEEYDDKGRIAKKVQYTEKGQNVTKYYTNGKVSEYAEYNEGKLDGVREFYDSDGTLGRRAHFVNGDREGLQEDYYANGRIWMTSNWKGGLQDGIFKQWGEDGSLKYMREYKQGEIVRDLLAEGVTEEDADNLNFSFVTDEQELERLEKEPTVTLYRAMAQIDGKLYPPMSTKEPNGPGQRGQKLKLRQPSELGRWERSDEAPDKAKQGKDGKWYFDLKKGNGGDVNGVLYNPYFHTSASPLNDQFSGAINYPELVTVAVEVPVSEFSSAYKADKANDTVGPKDWHSGTVTGQLGEGRQVVLTRWAKPTRIVPDSEVASIIAPKLIDKRIVVPSNVVTPTLKAELEKRGVVFDGKPSDYDNKPQFSLVAHDKEYLDAVNNGDMEKAGQMVREAAASAMPNTKVIDEDGKPLLMYHASGSKGITEFKKDKIRAFETDATYNGFWFSSSEDTLPAWVHKEALYKVFLDIKNPIMDRDADKVAKEVMRNLDENENSDAYPGARSLQDAVRMELQARGYDGVMHVYPPTLDEEALEREGKTVITLANGLKYLIRKGDDYNYEAYRYRYDSGSKEYYEDDFTGGYDTVEEIKKDPYFFDEQVWVAFEPNQIKSAEPVTYDDNGNIIPMSERFSDKDDIRFSMVQDEETNNKLFAAAKERFGVTRDIREAGYVLPDGDMLDFSGRHWTSGGDNSWLNGMRQVDHRDIGDLEFERDGNTPSGLETDMSDFIRRGAIRIDSSGSINLAVKPTPAQESALRRLMQQSRGMVWIDFGDGSHTDHSVSYEGISPERVINDIRRYFDEGVKPESKIMFSMVNDNQEVFVSNAAKAVEGIQNGKATPEQWLKQLEKNGGLKAGEDKWIGLSDWLKGQDKKTLTKQEVLDYINEHKIQIEETHYEQGTVGVEKALEVYNKEMQGYMQDPEELYDYADKQLEEFYIEMQEKYGEDFQYEMTESEQVAEERLLQARDDASNLEPEEEAYQQMVNKYGDDFEQAFELAGDELRPYEGMDGEISPEAIYFLRQAGYDGNPVNSTRLDYTTQGLENNHEIALTVPTIEPWGESDTLHFGDAGEGRAIAWIRFGDTTASGDKRVLVIDEIQSKRHQEGREKGYKDEELETKANRHNELSRKFYSSEGLTLDEHKEFRALQDELYAIGSSTIEKNRKAIPAAPFEKNWHELAMKRMLRYAAENGYDAIAWTTGEQQADRYNISKVISGIGVDEFASSEPNKKGWREVFLHRDNARNIDLQVDNEGVVRPGSDNFVGEKLSDVVGKDLAVKIMSADVSNGMVELDESAMKVGGAGMKGFYDDILPRFMNKYGKKWGVSVKDMELPIGEAGNEVMHAVEVTQEMRESVMEGQPMSSMVEEDKKGLPINDFYATIDSMFGDENFKPAEHSRERYNLGETPGWMKKVGLSGENFSLPFKSIREHKGKDSDHALTADEWKRLPDAVKNPFLVTKYKGADDRFRLYTGLLHNGKFVAVGVDVIPVNQGKDAPILEVNRIKTAFGVNGGLSQNEKIVAYDDKITPEQEALLRGLNYREYPTIQELSTTNVENNNEFTSISEKNNDISYSMVKSVEDKGKTGFAEVMGGKENLDELYDKVYRAIPRDILAPVVERAMNDDFNVRKHVDAYLHDLAKNGTENDETGLLRAVYDQVRAYSGNPDLSDNDIRYMIWKATSDAKEGDLLSLAEDIATRRRWGVGEDEPSFSMTKDFADVTDEAREKYEAKVAEAEKLRKEEKANIRKSFTEGLKPITKAMATQKTYDKVTVDGIAKFAKQVLKDGQVDALTFRETNRLLTLVAGANGKSPSFATRYSDQLLDLLLDHIVKKERTDFNNLVNVKDTAINQSGVETLGKIDLRGQITMKSFRDSRELSDKEIEDKLLEVSDRLSDPSDAVRSRAQAEYEGLMLAQEYKTGLAENIKEANDLEDELDYAKEAKKTGNIDKKSYDEYVRSTQEAIRENKMERVDLYRDFRKRLGDVVSEGVSRAKAFREANQLRIEAIHHDANRDMQGVPTNEHRAETRKERLINSDAARFFFKPLATFDQMLRVLGRKNMSGEGYLWNRYMRGWVDAAEKSYTGLFEATEELDKKASEVFGKNMIWSDLYGMERKMPGATVRFMDGGEMVEHELTPGNLLYIYMVDKMVDGRMKLRKMGISEDDVKAIKRNLDPRFIELADWLQEDFLVRKRNKYNAVHERMFGAPMADIQEYFPLKILANARIEEVDLGSKPDGSGLSSTTTGSIIKRRKNALALDLLHTDAFSLVIEHLQQMEDWAAFAEYRRDLNTLLSYKHFRNQVQNLNTIYGTGKALWGNFKDAASIASGSYKPKVGKGDVDTVVLNIAKGVTAAKIAFRVNTALKQVLSAPAYLPEVNILELGKALAKPGEAWNWCMENLPVFKKRWKSRLAGDTRLMDTESDWKIWRTNVVHTAGRMGMAPNAFVDAVTIAVGAKSIYETKYKRYIEDGYSETAADRRAKQDATIMYNQTQQSEEGPFVSPMQLDRTFLSVMLTTFRNSSMGYQRQLHDALRGLSREFDSTSKEARIDFMAKQRENEGADEESARRGAKKDYDRQKWRNLARVAIFGFGLQLLWNIGNDIWYLLFGKSDKKKKKILKDASMKGLAGPIEGMAGGNIVSDAWGSISSGEGTQYIGMGELPIVSDIKQILQEMEYDQPAAVNDIASLIIQAGVGVNPDTLTDTVVAVIDACNGDLGVAKEAALLLMRIAQIPQSTIDEFYIDELETSAAKAKRMTPSQLAKRYAEYRLKKETPLTNGLYDEKTEARRRKSYENRIKKKIKERK